MLVGRQELKHAISLAEYQVLRKKLAHFMRSDPYAGPNGFRIIWEFLYDVNLPYLIDSRGETDLRGNYVFNRSFSPYSEYN